MRTRPIIGTTAIVACLATAAALAPAALGGAAATVSPISAAQRKAMTPSV